MALVAREESRLAVDEALLLALSASTDARVLRPQEELAKKASSGQLQGNMRRFRPNFARAVSEIRTLEPLESGKRSLKDEDERIILGMDTGQR